MPHEGQEIHGYGLVLRLVSIAPDALVMEAAYDGSAGMPPEHLHPRQAERFTVLEGAVQTIVGGEERRYETGETFDVPAGTPHQMAADGPARTRWEVRPALRTAEFFERLFGTGPDSAAEQGYPEFLAEFSEEIRFG